MECAELCVNTLKVGSFKEPEIWIMMFTVLWSSTHNSSQKCDYNKKFCFRNVYFLFYFSNGKASDLCIHTLRSQWISYSRQQPSEPSHMFHIEHILTDLCALVKILEHSRRLFDDAGYNEVQCRKESVTPNLWPVVYTQYWMDVWKPTQQQFIGQMLLWV